MEKLNYWREYKTGSVTVENTMASLETHLAYELGFMIVVVFVLKIFKFFMVKYTYHIIYHLNHFLKRCTVQSFTLLCSHH